MKKTKKLFEEIILTGKIDEVNKETDKLIDKGYHIMNSNPIYIGGLKYDVSRRKVKLRKELDHVQIK